MTRAPYLKVYDTLLQEIRTQRILRGTALPGEMCLSKTYRVSRPTMRRALLKLAEEGYIGSRPGINWTVISNEPGQKFSRMERTIGVDLVEDNWSSFYSLPILRGMRRGAAGICRLELLDESRRKAGDYAGIHALALATVTEQDYPELLHLRKSGLRIALLNRIPEDPSFSYFAVDYRKESRRAVEYLLLLGHRRIAVGSQFPARIQGWRDAFLGKHLTPPEELILPYGKIESEAIAGRLKEQKVTAVFLTGGTQVPRLLHSAVLCGVRIPEDLSVICFDDVGMATGSESPVSCIRMPLETMGEELVQYLIRSMESSAEPEAVHCIMPASLVINNSCREL